VGNSATAMLCTEKIGSAAMRFEVGQEIWVGDFSALAPVYEICPDCGGTGRLRVTFHDETQVSIACANCALGYDPPTGRIRVHRQAATARKAIISGLEVNGGKTRWHIDGTECSWRIVEDEDAFETEAEALKWAKEKVARFEAEQRNKIFEKEKDTRSWAWNASYHRREIKEAERRLAYHTAKLNAAVLKVKEPKQLETATV
jgi:hypothetical protein